MSLPLLLGQLLALMGGGGALYLEVRELEEKCFIQEIPDGTVVIGARAASPGLTRLSPSPERGWGRAPRRSSGPHLSPAPGVGMGAKQVDSSLPKATPPMPVLGLGASRRQV